MKQYLDLMQHILGHGVKKEDRTGTGTLSVFGAQMRFDLADGFPLVTTKKVHLKSIIHELIWFLKGTGDVAYLREHGVKIWEEWTRADGSIGPGYGVQWRSWPVWNGEVEYGDDCEGYPVMEGVDQIKQVIEQIKINPDSRRLIVSAWNVAQIDDMALPPCHLLFQFYVANGRLSCQLYQRSADALLGLPFNIASYALLTMMIAQVTGLEPGEFVWTGGDVHLYLNHIEQAKLQLSREPRPLPTMTLNPAITDIDDFTYGDFTLSNYDPHPKIKAPVAV